MLVFGNEREIQQGEEWNLDIMISQSNTEYVPFIVSSERINPMFAITIASTKYEKNERYVDTWWLDLNKGSGFEITEITAEGKHILVDAPFPKFFQTVVQDLPMVKIGFKPTKPEADKPMECLYRYTKEEDKIDLETGHKPYYYVYFEMEDSELKTRYGYDCRVRMQFQSDVTSQWGSQNYMYQITLVDTIPMASVIKQARLRYPNLEWMPWIPDWVEPENVTEEERNKLLEDYENQWIMSNVRELYTFIKNRIPNWFQSDIDMDAPVGRIGAPEIILPPTKLQVNNNLRRII